MYIKELDMLMKNTRYKRVIVTKTVYNIKISAAESKIPDTSSLVTTTVLDKQITEMENKI